MSAITQKEFLTTIYEEIDQGFAEIVGWRRYLHEHPELSFEEYETAKFIADKLEGFGLEVKKGIGGNGLIGILKGEQSGKTIALRADFDALPITDLKEVTYKSQKEGVMHACGHDGHTTALLATAKTLSHYCKHLHGNIIFIFQHAEEKPPGGAKFMIAEDVLKDVDYVFGAHLDSGVPVGKVSVGDGYRMAAVDKFAIKIQGLGGHGAKPQQSIDSIVIGSEIVSSLQNIVSRRLNPFDAAVVTVGVFRAGSAFNIIADSAIIEGTVRTMTEDVRSKVKEEIYAIVKGTTESAHATYGIDYLRGYPALYNHPFETALVKELFENEFGVESVIDIEPSMGAEDFAYFLNERPGTYFKVGSRNDDERTQFPHHHPKFDFDERALLIIEKSFVKIVSHYLFK
ncbi:M20 metallopeptidase family protein [Viridibacillus sp. NPDC096237]|uniref:M20 metallopeptidase family protein n=1 Tax=Viridibacillus sp. NPDC096237 TaxID=3390721 RepID=UPI003D02B39B